MGLPGVREIQIEVTSKCNADCPFCINRASFASEYRPAWELSGQDIRDILDWICRSGITRVRFTGGEPLLRKDIAELLQYSAALGLTVIVNTNGQLVPRYASALRDHATAVLISMVSANPDITDSVMRARGSHKAKIRALEALQGYIRQL